MPPSFFQISFATSNGPYLTPGFSPARIWILTLTISMGWTKHVAIIPEIPPSAKFLSLNAKVGAGAYFDIVKFLN